jgi:putative oxygen-independent coproporphyrinogen III oxidase
MSIPLTLYIHIPWCIKKCPYCDFNSHELKATIPEMAYTEKLLQDLDSELSSVTGRAISAIFFGGGTPSLFSPSALDYLIKQLKNRLMFLPDHEITLEANPGTIDQAKFTGFRELGINRLSIGIQSFQHDKLQTLGRIHNHEEAEKAIEAAIKAGFSNVNLDLMFGLPNQTIHDALFDLRKAISFFPKHISWYQLTIEPHTRFHQFPPKLPDDDHIWAMQQEGQALLAAYCYSQYEVSAYSHTGFQCQHNNNYWEFGDYLGIGAGAHSKITDLTTGQIYRTWKIKHPKHYLERGNLIAGSNVINSEQLPFEFMLNALRLFKPIPFSLFEQRTGLSARVLDPFFEKAHEKGLLSLQDDYFETTLLGKRFLNDLVGIFFTA